MCEQSPLVCVWTYAEKSWIFVIFMYFVHFEVGVLSRCERFGI